MRAKFAEKRYHKMVLADVLGCSRPTAYGRINGRLDWPARDIERVSQFLDITPQRLNELAADVTRTDVDEVEPPLPVNIYEQPARARRKPASA